MTTTHTIFTIHNFQVACSSDKTVLGKGLAISTNIALHYQHYVCWRLWNLTVNCLLCSLTLKIEIVFIQILLSCESETDWVSRPAYTHKMMIWASASWKREYVNMNEYASHVLWAWEKKCLMAIHMEIYGLLNIRRLINDLFQSEIRIWFRLINELIGPLQTLLSITYHSWRHWRTWSQNLKMKKIECNRYVFSSEIIQIGLNVCKHDMKQSTEHIMCVVASPSVLSILVPFHSFQYNFRTAVAMI